MACLGAVLYDPATEATASTTALLAMTPFDTTNARVTFTAPANGIVLVKIRVPGKGSSTTPQVLLGVRDGATVRGRQAPIMPSRGFGSTLLAQREAAFLVTGLTPTTSYSFDACYGVETVVASTQLGWGGPNDTSSANAYGALSFEVWETANLLAGVHYDPATAATFDTATLSVMAAMDTTNLRLSFTAPASGRVAVRLRGCTHGNTSCPSVHLGVLDGSTIMMRQATWTSTANGGAPTATDLNPLEAFAVISGLTPSGSYTWDAAWAVEAVVASTAIKCGGPNDTTGDNAFGGFSFEVWEA